MFEKDGKDYQGGHQGNSSNSQAGIFTFRHKLQNTSKMVGLDQFWSIWIQITLKTHEKIAKIPINCTPKGSPG